MTFADSAESCASVLDTRFRSISSSALPRRGQNHRDRVVLVVQPENASRPQPPERHLAVQEDQIRDLRPKRHHRLDTVPDVFGLVALLPQLALTSARSSRWALLSEFGSLGLSLLLSGVAGLCLFPPPLYHSLTHSLGRPLIAVPATDRHTHPAAIATCVM